MISFVLNHTFLKVEGPRILDIYRRGVVAEDVGPGYGVVRVRKAPESSSSVEPVSHEQVK